MFLYVNSIADLHPSCGLNDPPPVPFIQPLEAQAGTLIHELGHVLQLGHDTEAEDGVNPWNVMALITGCPSARQRFHGEGNPNNASLGSTEDIFASRFSHQAIELMRFNEKLSVETSELLNEGRGIEH